MTRLVQEGLPEAEFWEAFIQCAECDHVFPTSMYPYAHRCNKKVKIALQLPKPEALDNLEGSATDSDEEDRREQQEEQEVDRQLRALQDAMRPRPRPRRIGGRVGSGIRNH